MASKVVVVVDNSNVYIEGQKFSAKMKDIVRQNHTDKEPKDRSWRIDFGKLLVAVSNGRTVEHAVLVGSTPPQSDTVWQAAQDSGFTVTVHKRNSMNAEKAVDTELVAQATEIICTTTEVMDLAILSGDRDFIPLVSVAHRRHWTVEMWAFKNAYNPTGQMAMEVDSIKPLDDIFQEISIYAYPYP